MILFRINYGSATPGCVRPGQENKTPATPPGVDLHVIQISWTAAVGDSPVFYPDENIVELLVSEVEGVVVALESSLVVEVQRQGVVCFHRREVPRWAAIGKSKDIREEPGRGFFVVGRNNGMV